MKKTNNNGGVRSALVGIGVASIAATAYFFLGPNSKKHQKNTKAWAIKMKADVIEKLERVKEVSESGYADIIDEVSQKYIKAKKSTEEEITDLAKDLKKHWRVISGKKPLKTKKV